MIVKDDDNLKHYKVTVAKVLVTEFSQRVIDAFTHYGWWKSEKEAKAEVIYKNGYRHKVEGNYEIIYTFKFEEIPHEKPKEIKAKKKHGFEQLKLF